MTKQAAAAAERILSELDRLRGEADEVGAVTQDADAMWDHWIEEAAKIIDAEFQPMRAGSGRDWKCKVLDGDTGDNRLPDCGWPCCGCDPYAEKVIASMEAAGNAPAAPIVAPGWIPVSERLPAVEFVLVAGRRDDGGWWRGAAKYLGNGDFRGGFGDTLHPSHWMPLPEPPEAKP